MTRIPVPLPLFASTDPIATATVDPDASRAGAFVSTDGTAFYLHSYDDLKGLDDQAPLATIEKVTVHGLKPAEESAVEVGSGEIHGGAMAGGSPTLPAGVTTEDIAISPGTFSRKG